MTFDFQQFPENTRGRIVTTLRRGPATVDAIASELGLSHNAVRVQLTRMERDDVVRRIGVGWRTTRPSQLYELTPAVTQLLSRAYVPFWRRSFGRLPLVTRAGISSH